jgi:nucleoside-diphosphate-sugar epimerase
VGAAGFIGRHTARSLAAKGCKVIRGGHGRWTADEARAFGLQRWIDTDITLDAVDALPTIRPIYLVDFASVSPAFRKVALADQRALP